MNGCRMRVHWPPPRNTASHDVAGWNMARPDTASRMKQIAVTQ
jgi:hypothetical protein